MAASRDDDVLIGRCLAGERQAFDVLVARQYRGVYNIAYRMVGNADDAADLTQEVFVRAYSRLETFRLGQSLTAWLRRMTVNLTIDHLRRRWHTSVSLDERRQEGHEPAATDRQGSPQDQLEIAEDSRRMLAAVQRLPEKQRAVLVLRHVEGLKLEEIADTMQIPLGTVKTLLFRGREAIRQMVGEL